MSNRNQQLGTFLHGFSIEVHRPVFGHDPLHMGAGSHHARTGSQYRRNLADALVGHRRHRDDRLATLAQRSPADEIHLTAHSGIELGTQRVGANLTGKVDLQSRVNRCHLGVLGNNELVVGITHIHHQHARVIIQEIIYLLASHHKGGHNLAPVYRLVLAVDDPFANQLKHAVGEHLGMDTQVLMVAQLRKHRIGNRTDTHLQGSPVLNQGSHVLADFLFHRRRLGEMGGNQRGIVFGKDIDHVHRNHRVPEHPRHLGIDGGNHRVGRFNRGQGGIHRAAQGHIAVLVGRRNLNQGHIGTAIAFANQALGILQEHRNIVGITRLGVLADIRPGKEGFQQEDAFEFRRGVRSRAFGMQVLDPHVLELVAASAFAHCLNQFLGSASDGVDMHPVVGLDDLYRFFGGNDFQILHISVFFFFAKNVRALAKNGTKVQIN